LSPEQEESKSYNEKIDIYAMGLILFEMCQKFSTGHERISTLNNLKYKRKLPSDFSEMFSIEAEIILNMTDHNPENRPSAEQILKSESMEKWAQLA